MEAIAAVGLASNVISFIDFGVKAVSGVRDIYYSSTGASKENGLLEKTLNELSQGVSHLKEGLRDRAGCLSKDDKKLEDLARNCIATADKIHYELTKLKVERAGGKPGKLDAFKKKYRSMRKRSEIDELNKELLEQKEAVKFWLAIDLR